MKVDMQPSHTDIILDKEEVMAWCRPGEGDDTCIWLLVGPKGFECSVYHKPHVLLDRWQRGETNAKRDGCDGKGSGPPGVFDHE